MDFSHKVACVVDNGLFAFTAETLAKSFGKTYLYIPWESAYPRSNQMIVGTGLRGVTKIDSPWPVLGEVDLWVFPDVYFGAMQVHLRSLGKRVWGSAMGEELELFRDYSKQALKKVGLDVGPYQVVKGLAALRAYLKAHENQYVKISRSRGDFETFKSETYALSEPRLDQLEHTLGAKKTIVEFIVEEAIADAVEIGYDGFAIDGEYPAHAMTGIEVKDKSYIGVFRKYDAIAEPIRAVNAAVAPLLKQYQYRNFWAAEARVTKDGTPWVIDPCARSGSPPSELAQLMYTNLAEIFWHGAAGEVVDPTPASTWGAQIMVVSSWANDNWQAIDFPDSVRDQVKLHFPVVIDGKYYTTPQGFDLPAVAAVCAVGATLEAAIANVRKVAEQVRGYYLEIPAESLDDAQKELARLKEFGVRL